MLVTVENGRAIPGPDIEDHQIRRSELRNDPGERRLDLSGVRSVGSVAMDATALAIRLRREPFARDRGDAHSGVGEAQDQGFSKPRSGADDDSDLACGHAATDRRMRSSVGSSSLGSGRRV